MEKKLWQQKRRKGLQVAAAKREKKGGKKDRKKGRKARKKGKAAALGKEGKEGKEGGNLGILFSRFYLLKLMSFFWFNLRIMCN